MATLAPTSAASSGFWDQFVTSAGFAGAMAVVAASIAAVVGWRQFRATQRHNEEARWWDTLTWVYDRSIVEKDTKAPLSETVRTRMLNSLLHLLPKQKKKGGDKLRGDTIESVLDMFKPQTPEAVALEADLRKDLARAGYGRDANPAELYFESTLRSRVMVGSIAILLPFLLIIGEAFFLRGGVHAWGSIGAYYHSSMRDIFVAGLCMIGLLLVIYMATEIYTWDFWLSLVAGVAVFGMVFFPVARSGLPASAPRCGTLPEPIGCSPIQQALGEAQTSHIHAVFAVVFILCGAAISFQFAYREQKRKEQNRVLARSHLLCGATMLAALAWAIAGGLLKLNFFELTPLYVAETFGLWAFGVSWLAAGLRLTAPVS